MMCSLSYLTFEPCLNQARENSLPALEDLGGEMGLMKNLKTSLQDGVSSSEVPISLSRSIFTIAKLGLLVGSGFKDCEGV